MRSLDSAPERLIGTARTDGLARGDVGSSDFRFHRDEVALQIPDSDQTVIVLTILSNRNLISERRVTDASRAGQCRRIRVGTPVFCPARRRSCLMTVRAAIFGNPLVLP
jgi:hypothetical protein